MTRPVLVAGPTASGKSAVALALARKLGGAIINADSQQIFREWRILSARPSPAEEALAPHFLYGHVAMSRPYSVGDWLSDMSMAKADCAVNGLRPIIVGGTGLYFKALTEGLASIPPIPADVRKAAEAMLAEHGIAKLAGDLAERDPGTAAATDLANPVRVLRAWEVLAATGTGLKAWQERTGPALIPPEGAERFVLTPDRDWLYARCDARLDRMIEAGALDEVRKVMARGIDPALPGMKAVGAPELMAHLRGEMTLEDAIEAAKIQTRRYAKRQLTWARNQMAQWTILAETDPAALAARALKDLTNNGQ